MSVEPAFEITIVECEVPPEVMPLEVLSGRIRLVIGGVVVLGPDETDRSSLAKSALALSRTLNEDHAPEDPWTPHLVYHECGWATSLDTGCLNDIDWRVTHDGDVVRLSDVIDHSEGPSQTSPAPPTVILPAAVYRANIGSFCSEVLRLAAAVPAPSPDDEYASAEWSTWQAEVRERLAGGTSIHKVIVNGEELGTMADRLSEYPRSSRIGGFVTNALLVTEERIRGLLGR